MQNYRELDVWKLSHQLAVAIYQATANFPDAEKFGLTSQIRRSAVSIPSNIAEGCGRKSNAELEHFLYISGGSASELDYQLLLAQTLGFLDETQLTSVRKLLYRFTQSVAANNPKNKS
jgi:four helix bundle protein